VPKTPASTGGESTGDRDGMGLECAREAESGGGLLWRSGLGRAELGAIGCGIGEGGFPASHQRGVVEEGVSQPPAGSALLEPGSAWWCLLGLHQLDS